ncbi:MAG: nucleotidyltransferase [Elusimicrobia bacterium]|nr:nucleotidyltransferase [Elusimicrobiota bacterium]
MLGLPPEPVAKTYRFLDHCGYPYVIVGAVASSILGEPRFTSDFDAIVYIGQEDAPGFLQKAKTAGFDLDEQKSLVNIKNSFMFQAKMDSLGVDFLIAATAFEMEMLSRSRAILVDKYSIRVPSPEDLILMKLIANRDKDILDVKNVALKHAKKLDVSYMKQWANAWKSADSQSQVLSRLEQLLKSLP